MPAADALSARGAGNSANGKWIVGNRARIVANRAVSGRDAGHRNQTLPADAGLNLRLMIYDLRLRRHTQD